MVRRGVNLAQAVCAVYSLSRPAGASRAEIVKFCVQRFGSVRDPRRFDRVLERAVDQGLLKVFRRRYRLAKTTNCILWAQGKKKVRDCASRSVVKRRTKRSASRSKTCKTFIERTSSFYKLWCKARGREVSEMDRRNRRQDRKSKRTVVKKEHVQRGRYSLRSQKCGTSSRNNYKTKSQCQKRKDMHDGLSSKRDSKSYKSYSTQNHKTARSCKNSTRSQAPSDIHRQVLQQTKNAVLHSKSWDRLNEKRQKSQMVNRRLMKNSQLVQKILTRSHGPSWDDLNNKLRRLKKAQSIPEVDGGGDLEPRRSHVTTASRSHRASSRQD